MKSKYLTRLIAPLAMGIMTGCATINQKDYSQNSKPRFVGRKNGVERFVGTEEQVENFARMHFLDSYDISNNQVYAEGVTMSRHRYEASTSEDLLDGDAINGPSKAIEHGRATNIKGQ